MTGDKPICQVCQARKATVSYNSWRSGQFVDRSFVCMECAPAFENLMHGTSGQLARFVASASLDRARAAGIDPMLGCPGCGTTLVQIMTDATTGCELCYDRFFFDLEPTISSLHGWGAHIGKSPNG